MVRKKRISIEERRQQLAAGVSIQGRERQFFTLAQLAVLGSIEQGAKDGVFTGGLNLAAGPAGVTKATALSTIRLAADLQLIEYNPGQGASTGTVRLLWLNKS